jgi:hypothetical protein
MTELVKKWEKTGLLTGIDDEKKETLSCILENVYEFIIDTRKVDKQKEFEIGMMLPLATRIFRENPVIDIWPERLLSVMGFVKKRYYQQLLEQSYLAVDAEAELCVVATDEYVKQYGGDSNAL